MFAAGSTLAKLNCSLFPPGASEYFSEDTILSERESPKFYPIGCSIVIFLWSWEKLSRKIMYHHHHQFVTNHNDPNEEKLVWGWDLWWEPRRNKCFTESCGFVSKVNKCFLIIHIWTFLNDWAFSFSDGLFLIPSYIFRVCWTIENLSVQSSTILNVFLILPIPYRPSGKTLSDFAIGILSSYPTTTKQLHIFEFWIWISKRTSWMLNENYLNP